MRIFKFQWFVSCEIAKTKFHFVRFFLLTLYFVISMSYKKINRFPSPLVLSSCILGPLYVYDNKFLLYFRLIWNIDLVWFQDCFRKHIVSRHFIWGNFPSQNLDRIMILRFLDWKNLAAVMLGFSKYLFEFLYVGLQEPQIHDSATSINIGNI